MVEETTRHTTDAGSSGKGSRPEKTKSAKQLAAALRRKMPAALAGEGAVSDSSGDGSSGDSRRQQQEQKQ